MYVRQRAVYGVGMTAEQEADLVERIKSIQARQADDARARKIAVWIAGAGAVFAAIRLGVIFAPSWKRQQVQAAVSGE